MKKLIYTFTFLLFIFSLTSCSTQDPLEDISIEIPENEIVKSEEKKTKKENNKDDTVRDGIPF